tara:strand:- start:657 stop:1028 length:372 start_codon:yes stop_codon:yes gene_type:complete
MMDKKHADTIKKYFGGKSPWASMNNTQKVGAGMDAVGGILNVASMVAAPHSEEKANSLGDAAGMLGMAGSNLYGMGNQFPVSPESTPSMDPNKDSQTYQQGGFVKNKNKNKGQYSGDFKLNVQ